jgi:transposase
MRLQIIKSKNAASYYVVKSVYENGRRSSKVVEKLGTEEYLRQKLNGQDPIMWAKAYVEELNRKEKDGSREILVKYLPTRQIAKDEQCSFNCGYLFLKKIYHDLKLNKISKEISQKYKFEYNLDEILSRLVYGRILFPSSKLSTMELSKKLIEEPHFELHHIYRALEVISKETDFIQAELYKNSVDVIKRNTNVIYYDCTNYFFEIEQEDGLKQYGLSKEHRPNPIVQMGLFMDGDGIPLAFSINKGNTNEQTTLQPLEKKILEDFDLSKFIVCTDAGLASTANRKFNDKKNRAFITTQSIKKLKKIYMDFALSPQNWRISGDNRLYNLDEIMSSDSYEQYKDNIFYKEQWIKEDGLEQKLLVTFSLKYQSYQRKIRNSQLDRAKKAIDENPKVLTKQRQTDYKRFVAKTSVTKDGEVAEKQVFAIDNELIAKEEMFDGFYTVCTNLESSAEEIIKINKRRWEIEECFRIMKSEFKARPVYLSRDDRIKAHFTTCFISLVLYRILEKRLDEKFTTREIIGTLRDMNMLKIKSDGYIPSYTRTDLTDVLHEKFGFRTDLQIVSTTQMKKILKNTKN